ncbi:Radical s-adenosyl methionine domain-containing 2 protein [Rutstroemia sp. NJR-2017a BBW]|nr:Radical s-adenosyl methionine domain-containing 2 protein [Rutstroemia sp. NJR-2017a BBW]
MLSALLHNNSTISSITGAFSILGVVAYFLYHFHQLRHPNTEIPVSVNYHFSRKCNFECGFFHTKKTSSILSLDEAKQRMKLLKEAGMRKLNFAGAEPFLYHTFMQKLLRYGKEVLEIESISIVSNGSKTTEKFLRENAAYIDIVAISCDSFNVETNIKIGRGKKGENVEQLKNIAAWCQELECFVPENNEMVKGSYLILEEGIRFLDKSDREDKASKSILDVGVRKAMTQVRWERGFMTGPRRATEVAVQRMTRQRN